ncbi:PREDICTED: cancer-related nucleoside-triphosphatase homolog isoform X2 [Branchiostoma belcheri]|uniref:Cancer-related nucleoside-triphosphatase homolog isoform X2 n=1 Tax=Branchiostoma belcheri TaxID=7741 RepID=A0A6P4YJN0_BRABE|nr:PREDICTED: cancer-related nucleoside-triphosphatase homolog isoform X2 [Branchiostoma belcheri]
MASAGVGGVRHVLLTGPPGIGKTTLTQKACEVLQKDGVRIQGFYTEEVRTGGRRQGFDIITLDGQRGPLARVCQQSGDQGRRREYRVGQYLVNLPSFEGLALPVLRFKPPSGTKCVYIIDEIGKMEMFSQHFIQAVRLVLDSPGSTVLATLPVAKGRPLPVVEEIRRRNDATLFTVTKENRDSLVPEVVAAIKAALH